MKSSLCYLIIVLLTLFVLDADFNLETIDPELIRCVTELLLQCNIALDLDAVTFDVFVDTERVLFFLDLFTADRAVWCYDGVTTYQFEIVFEEITALIVLSMANIYIAGFAVFIC